MTKTEARRWVREARQGLRDVEEALRTGDLDLLQEGLLFASASPEEIRAALNEGTLAGFEEVA